MALACELFYSQVIYFVRGCLSMTSPLNRNNNIRMSDRNDLLFVYIICHRRFYASYYVWQTLYTYTAVKRPIDAVTIWFIDFANVKYDHDASHIHIDDMHHAWLRFVIHSSTRTHWWNASNIKRYSWRRLLCRCEYCI